jgi:hypothetical protein
MGGFHRQIRAFSCFAVIWTSFQQTVYFWQSNDQALIVVTRDDELWLEHFLPLGPNGPQRQSVSKKSRIEGNFVRSQDQNALHSLHTQGVSLRKTETQFNARSLLRKRENVPLLVEPDHQVNALPTLRKSGETKRHQRIPHTRKRRKLLFVYVDETSCGGETIRRLSRAGCYSYENDGTRQTCFGQLQRVRETRISRTMYTTLHRGRLAPFHNIQAATTFLWSIRDPLDRMVAWFDQTKQEYCSDHGASKCEGWMHKFFRRCFPNEESFVQSLAGNYSHVVKTSTNGGTICSELAWRVVRGDVPRNESSFYNYQHYANRTITAFPGKEIMVVRAEHLRDDLGLIEEQLGGNNKQLFTKESYGSYKCSGISLSTTNKATSLSGESQRILCCALLESDIYVYVDLVTRGANLDDSSRKETLDSLWRKCGVDSLKRLGSVCK